VRQAGTGSATAADGGRSWSTRTPRRGASVMARNCTFSGVAMGPRADEVLRPINDWVRARWPFIVGPLAVVIGVGVLAYGIVKLTG